MSGLLIAGVPANLPEVSEWRWQNGKVFRVEKSRYLWIAHSKPLHYQVGTDPRWSDIDNTWQPSKRAGFAWEMTRCGYKAWMAGRAESTPFLLLERDGRDQEYRLGDVLLHQEGIVQAVAAAPRGLLQVVQPNALGLDWKGLALRFVADTGRFAIQGAAPANQLSALGLSIPAVIPGYLSVQLLPYGGSDVQVMTDYVGETADGHIVGHSAIYATARSSSTGMDDTATTANIGQMVVGTYDVWRSFLSFNTSAIDDAHTIASAVLYVKASTNNSNDDFLVQVYNYAWTEALGGGNQEANYDGAYGGSATLEGTFRNTADGWVSGTWYNMAMAGSGINKAGDTKYTMVSKEDVDGSQPAGLEFVAIVTADEAGTGSDPYMAITTMAPGFAGIF